MKNLKSFLDAISKVGTNEKIAQLKTLQDHQQEIIGYMLDPYRMYGIKSTLELSEPQSSDLDDWNLVRILLDKLSTRQITGGDAISAIKDLSAKMSADEQEILKRILLKDTKAGIGISLANKAFKSAFKIEVFEVQLATSYRGKDCDLDIPQNPKAKFPLIGQQKLDGMRVICEVNSIDKLVNFVTRTGKPITTLDHLKEKMLMLGQTMYENYDMPFVSFDGEATVGNFNGTVSALRKKNVKAIGAIFHVFDFFTPDWRLLYRKDKSTFLRTSIKQMRRLVLLSSAVVETFGHNEEEIQFLPFVIHNSHEELITAFRRRLDNNEEGEMAKDPDAPYEFKRTRNWWKLKDEQSQDGVIIGVKAGAPESEFANTLGSVTIQLENGVVVEAAGIKHKYLDEIYFNADKYIGRSVEVHYHEMTPDGSLRHPRLKWPSCLRDDDSRLGDKE